MSLPCEKSKSLIRTLPYGRTGHLRQILWHVVSFPAQEPGVAEENEDVSLGILTQVSVWSPIS